MMPRHSIWRHIRNNSRRSKGSQRSKKSGKGFWGTALFQPHKSDMLPVWRDMYRLNRQLKMSERGLYQPTPMDETWLGSVKSGMLNAWHDLVDELKALLTMVALHILTLVLVIVFNLIWFWLLFKLVGLWLRG